MQAKQVIYTEDMPVVMQFRIGVLIEKMQNTTGLAKIPLIKEYRLRAEMYNNIVGMPIYYLEYKGTKESEY